MGAWSGIFGITFIVASTQLIGVLRLPMLNWVLIQALDALETAGVLLLAVGGFVFVVAMMWSAV